MTKKSTKSLKFKGLTTGDVEDLTGVSARKLRWWDEKGLVKPGRSSNRKHSQKRRYNLQDIVSVLVVKNLREKGLSLQKIKKGMEMVENTGVEHPLAKLRVACLAQTILFKKDGNFFEPISGQMVIKEVLEEIRPKIERRRLVPVERAIKRANQHYKEKLANF